MIYGGMMMKEKTISNFISCLCYSAILGLAAASMPAMAQIPVSAFELDENTADDATAGPDWENPPAVNGFVSDVPSEVPIGTLTNKTFTQGSKDTKDVSEWVWKVSSTVTPKTDIQHAYSAYVKQGDDLLYFGLDRLSTVDNTGPSGGTTSFGFWAFQDAVQDLADGSFDGEHKQGDLFIAGDMSGNTIDSLRVYIWDGGDGTAGELVEITAQGNIHAHCGDAALINGGTEYDTDACGEINTTSFSPDWIVGDIEAGRFIEVGLNYTEMVGPLPCFNTFMATTRTSDSETASTKNYVLGSFPVCSIDVAKTCETVELVDPFAVGGPTWKTEFTATVENDGGAAFSSTAVVTVTDAGADQVFGPNPGNGGINDDIVVTRTVGDLTTPDDGSDGFDSGEFLDVLANGLTITGSYINTDNGGMNKVKASIVDGPLSVSSGIQIQQCEPLSLKSALYIEKDCDNLMLTTEDLSGLSLNQVGITVDYDIRACNTGEFALDTDLSDPTAGISATGIILSNGEQCGGTKGACPAGSSCIGFGGGVPPDEVFGVCVDDSDPDGQLGPDGSLVCTRATGTYLVTGLTGGATTATPYDAIFSNTATIYASEADNPLLDEGENGGNDDDISISATAGCPLCDEDDDHIADYLDPDSGP